MSDTGSGSWRRQPSSACIPSPFYRFQGGGGRHQDSCDQLRQRPGVSKHHASAGQPQGIPWKAAMSWLMEKSLLAINHLRSGARHWVAEFTAPPTPPCEPAGAHDCLPSSMQCTQTEARAETGALLRGLHLRLTNVSTQSAADAAWLLCIRRSALPLDTDVCQQNGLPARSSTSWCAALSPTTDSDFTTHPPWRSRPERWEFR